MGELFAQYDVLGAFWMTIKLSVLSIIGATVLGAVLALMRVSPSSVMRFVGAAYVTLFRNTPLTLLLVLCYFGIFFTLRISPVGPSAPFATQSFAWAVIALTLYHASFVCEALRSGINTVPPGQAEAARAIGLGFGQTISQVIFPQAIRGALAPLGNTYVAQIKNTTVAAIIGVAEASLMMKNMIEFNSGLLVFIFALMALGFVILTLPIGALFTHLSERLGVQR